MSDDPSGPYDQVLIHGAGGEKKLTRAEFEALPLDERVRSVLQRRLKFFRRGVEIPVRDALKSY
jgi:hypothetical protein